MKLVRTLSLFAIAMAAVCISAQSASAQNPYCSGGFPWNNCFSSPYASSRIPTPPYFAIHPPVYYSVPVPRTYGYSPYAYPGTMQTPEIEVAKAAMIENPYATKKASEQKLNDKTASKSRMIVNPFVTSGSSTALASTEK
ncbi:MAG: hypothetical protein KDB27_12095 [Planctomycetales bacterium]|nr:hypothetical protein [Planctomycetales bacterium]